MGAWSIGPWFRAEEWLREEIGELVPALKRQRIGRFGKSRVELQGHSLLYPVGY